MSVQAPASSAPRMWRIAFASFIGTVIEFFDFFIFGTASALIFNKIFFPALDPLAGTLASFATFGVAFAARPLGGVVFGHFGDRLGRKAMLVLSLVLMGAGTAAVGALPHLRPDRHLGWCCPACCRVWPSVVSGVGRC